MNISATKTPAGGARIGSNSGLGRLARWCYAKRRRVVLLWVVGLIVITGASQVWHGVFQNKFSGGNSESARAQTFLQHAFPSQAGDTAQIVFHTTDPISDRQPGPHRPVWPARRPPPRRRCPQPDHAGGSSRSAPTATSPTPPCSSTS